MKYSIIITLAVSLSTVTAQEPKPAIHHATLDQNSLVEINLEGTILLENWDSQSLEIRLTTRFDGEIHGLSNHQDRTPYDVSIEESGSKLIVKQIARTAPWVIGVSTLSERALHEIHLPRNANVIVNSKNGKLVVNGSFSTLQVRNAHGESHLYVNPESLKFLSATTIDGQIVQDNRTQSGHHTFLGPGSLVYAIKSEDGLIAISTHME